MISQLSEEEKSRGVIACSAGNHAQGVALASQRMGIKLSSAKKASEQPADAKPEKTAAETETSENQETAAVREESTEGGED